MFTRPMCAAILLASVISLAGCGFSRGMSANDVAAYFEKTAPGMKDVACTTLDTNGWKYSCSYTDADTGARMRVGANVAKNAPGGPAPYGTGAVPVNDPLPPPHS